MDSDSDFAPGAFVPEPTKKKKVKTSAGKKRRLDVLEKSPRPNKIKRSGSASSSIFPQGLSDDIFSFC